MEEPLPSDGSEGRRSADLHLKLIFRHLHKSYLPSFEITQQFLGSQESLHLVPPAAETTVWIKNAAAGYCSLGRSRTAVDTDTGCVSANINEPPELQKAPAW